MMREIEGENITVYWLDGNDGEVIKAIAYIGNSYMCELLPKPLSKRSKLETTPEHTAARELMSSYVATIQGYQNQQRKSVRQVVLIDNRKTTLNDNFRIFNRETTEPLIEFEREAAVLDEPEEEFDCAEIQTNTTSFKERFKNDF